MARSCKQLLDAPDASATPAIDALEVVWIDSVLEFPTTDGTPGEVARMSCVLASLVTDDAALATFARLAASLAGVRVRRERFSGSGRIAAFGAALRDRTDDFADVVIALGDAPTDANDAHRLLDAVRGRDRDVTGLVVAVSSHAGALRDLPGFDGYLVAPAGETASIAAKFLVAVGSMVAPVLISCVDSEDIRFAIGSASSPAHVVDALWLEGRRELVFASLEDEQLVRDSADCTAFIYLARMAGMAATQALRALSPDVDWHGFQMPLDYFAGTGLPGLTTPITLVCAN